MQIVSYFIKVSSNRFLSWLLSYEEKINLIGPSLQFRSKTILKHWVLNKKASLHRGIGDLISSKMNVLTEGGAFHLSPVVMGDIYPNVEDAKVILCATVVTHVLLTMHIMCHILLKLIQIFFLLYSFPR